MKKKMISALLASTICVSALPAALAKEENPYKNSVVPAVEF